MIAGQTGNDGLSTRTTNRTKATIPYIVPGSGPWTRLAKPVA